MARYLLKLWGIIKVVFNFFLGAGLMELFDEEDIHKYSMKQMTEFRYYPVQMFA